MKKSLRRKKYVPNLEGLQRICSRNYALLLRLLPIQYPEQQQWRIEVDGGLTFDLSVDSISKYTECFKLKQTCTSLPKTMAVEIEFRLYHDAQMVEVTGYQNKNRIRASYPYPNSDLHHKDEKYQINNLLKDWLNLAVNQQQKAKQQSLLTNG